MSDKSNGASGFSMRLQPATMNYWLLVTNVPDDGELAMELCLLFRLWHARSIATMLLEHAVSICTLGLRRSKYQLSRLERVDGKTSVIVVWGVVSGSLDRIRQ